MSQLQIIRQYCAMFTRHGFEQLSPFFRRKMEITYPCPGNRYDPNPRRKLVFERRQGHSQVVYRLYWRRQEKVMP